MLWMLIAISSTLMGFQIEPCLFVLSVNHTSIALNTTSKINNLKIHLISCCSIVALLPNEVSLELPTLLAFVGSIVVTEFGIIES